MKETAFFISPENLPTRLDLQPPAVPSGFSSTANRILVLTASLVQTPPFLLQMHDSFATHVACVEKSKFLWRCHCSLI
jgi:hypothetical protein